MRWQVVGQVDKGSITFPNIQWVSHTYDAKDWRDAVMKGRRLLVRSSNQLGTPVDIASINRIKPPIPKL